MQRRSAALVTVELLFPDLAGEQQGVGIELEAVADLAVEFATRFEVLRQPQQVPVGVCVVSVFARALSHQTASLLPVSNRPGPARVYSDRSSQVTCERHLPAGKAM